MAANNLFLGKKQNKTLFTHGFENGFVRLVINAIPQWVVDGVVFTLSCTNVLQTDMEDFVLRTVTWWLFSDFF